MNNVYKFKQWYIMSNGSQDFKILLTEAQYQELSLYFPIHKPNISLFKMVEYPELCFENVTGFLQFYDSI